MDKCTECRFLDCTNSNCYCRHKGLNNIGAPRQIHDLTKGVPDWCPLKEDKENGE